MAQVRFAARACLHTCARKEVKFWAAYKINIEALYYFSQNNLNDL